MNGFIHILLLIKKPARAACLLALLFYLLDCPSLRAQQTISFSIEGKVYVAKSNWTIKHNGLNFNNQTEHTLDWAKSRSLDLAVHFTFQNDSVPAGSDIVWGFQYIQNGGRLSPGSNEKRSRSVNQFQRFDIAAAGPASLAIIPKIWKKTGSNQYEVIGQANPTTLNFTFTDSSVPVQAESPLAANTPVDTGEAAQPVARPVQPVTPLAELPDEETAYMTAKSLQDTFQKVKALIDFVDKYSAVKPKSVLVAKAIKDVPLGISLPDSEGDGTYSMVLHHAIKPVIDSNQVRGWRYNLSPTEFGKYRLTLYDLKDSVHSIKITDIGKNAPYNRPKEIQPFQKILVRLIDDDRDSFRISVDGGTPPFIVFLSQKGIARERYVINTTNTVKAFAKAICRSCENGSHTVEVYTSDFSTLLLRRENAVYIFKPNYLLWGLGLLLAFLAVYLGYGRIRRLWQIFQYQRKLRQINEWEIREARKTENQKKS